jgi:hypothetical protein
MVRLSKQATVWGITLNKMGRRENLIDEGFRHNEAKNKYFLRL